MAIEFPCSGCAELFVVAEEMAGRKGKCPKCALINVVPRPKVAIPSASQNGSAGTSASASTVDELPVLPAPDAESKPAEPAPVKWAAPTMRKNRGGVPWFLLAGLVGILLIALAIGGYFFLGYRFPGRLLLSR